MSDRYTIRDAEKSFVLLCELTGHRVAERYNDVGAWALDYNPIYGGVVIHEPVNDGGGVSEPFGSGRVSPREFCAQVLFLARALDTMKAVH